MVELKCFWGLEKPPIQVALNRTMVELKWGCINSYTIRIFTLNRTMVELK